METFVRIFGPLDALHGQIELVLLGLVVLNMVTRHLSHRHHVEQYDDGGPDAVSRYLPHVLTNFVLVLGSFYYLTVHHHGGFILSMLVVGMVVTDFFEFESRKVEARRDLSLDAPKAAITAWAFALAYIAYQVLLPSGTIGTLF